VVKTTGPPPAGATDQGNGVFKDAQGNFFMSPENNYYRQNPVYNRIGPVDGGQEYVFTNGVDFGVTVRY
jgi:hypothetical protein